MITRFPFVHAALLLAGLLSLAGCCGGYAVVRTTFQERAQMQGAEVSTGSAAVLHYSRLGEPPNACGSGKQYVEDLWIQVPSLSPGQPFTIGAPGVNAVYRRDQDGNPVRANRISGTVQIKERSEKGSVALLRVEIALPSGDSVKLDDEYVFHPFSGGE